jgi:AraC family transcriptional activator of pyochelin receptor
MAISLSDKSWCDLWDESRQQAQPGDSADSCDLIALCPESIGEGYKRDITLPSGIQLTLHRYQFYDDLISAKGQEDITDCLEWVFNLSSVYNFWDNSYVENGQHYIAGQCSPGSMSQQLAQVPRVAVDIHLDPATFQGMIGHHHDSLSSEVQRLVAGDETLPFSRKRSITPAMQRALQQILHCPFQGVIKQLHLESKSLELIALWLEQAIEDAPSPLAMKVLNGDDRDRIHAAKAILQRQFHNPPSLQALARQVGLNDCTLKRGFRQEFGTTVFGYVGDLRMEQACYLLLQGDLKVEEVADAVGYANRSRFAAAFRRKFGQNPKAYQMANGLKCKV